jgi:hypothetical protein
VLVCCLYSGHHVFAQTGKATLKLQAANTATSQAFNSVLDAEKAGANITSLLSQLNNAEGILAQAENLYRTGDFNACAVKADMALSIAREVAIAAQGAKQTAVVSSQDTFWYNITFIEIAALIFGLSLFLIWRWFKRWFKKSRINRLSELKLEVNSNEA